MSVCIIIAVPVYPNSFIAPLKIEMDTKQYKAK